MLYTGWDPNTITYDALYGMGFQILSHIDALYGMDSKYYHILMLYTGWDSKKKSFNNYFLETTNNKCILDRGTRCILLPE